MTVSELKKSEYHGFYQTYIDTLDITAKLQCTLQGQLDDFPSFIAHIPEDKWQYAYADGKWTVAEVFLHIMDTERIFQYRALRFSRGDSAHLPGFDQDLYVPASNAANRDKESIVKEYKAVRNATLSLFDSFLKEDLKKTGTASGSKMSVAALGLIICGHQRHHRNIIRERYL